MRTAVLFGFLLTVGCAHAADSSGAYIVLGEGVSSCANYLKSNATQAPFFHQWLAGFITATNEARVASKTFKQPKPDQLIDWIDRYCIVNPDEQFAMAALALVESAERNGGLMPYDAIPVLAETDDGSFVPLLDKTTGLQLFELNGENWTIRGPVKTVQKPKARHRATGSQSTQEAVPLGGMLLGPAEVDAYGPGLHSDGTGRPFTYRTRDGRQVFGPVTPSGYGFGVHIDQYGRPVYAVPK